MRTCFNPRAHEGHDPCRSNTPWQRQSFNPRAHEGHDPFGIVSVPVLELFQSTCPRRARLSSATWEVSPSNVSIHVPTKGTTPQASCFAFPSDCFNPRAHEGHDYIYHIGRAFAKMVSIHVPTKGTTSDAHKGGHKDGVSIHVPTKGTTSFDLHFEKRYLFQSTCPRRARPHTYYGWMEKYPFQSTCPRRARPLPIYPIPTII